MADCPRSTRWPPKTVTAEWPEDCANLSGPLTVRASPQEHGGKLGDSYVSAFRADEVIVETPSHDRSLHELEVNEVADVIRTGHGTH